MRVTRTCFHYRKSKYLGDLIGVVFQNHRFQCLVMLAASLEIHPYEVAEILALPVVEANPSYTQWIYEETENDI